MTQLSRMLLTFMAFCCVSTSSLSEQVTYFVDTKTGQTYAKPSELPADISDWLGPDLEILGKDLLPELKGYLRHGVNDLKTEHDASIREDEFGRALPYVISKWWPHLVEISLAVDNNGNVNPNQVFFVHGDQASHYNDHRGSIKTAEDARKYFQSRAPDLEFGVIRRPEVTSPQLRTDHESKVVQSVMTHLAETYEISGFRVIAQSGAFPLMHDVAVQRGDFDCIVGSSGIGDHMTFFRTYNPNTSVTWASSFLDPVRQVADLPTRTKIVLIHDPKDKVVALTSIQKYVDAASSAGVHLTTRLDATASDAQHHDTVAMAALTYQAECAR